MLLHRDSLTHLEGHGGLGDVEVSQRGKVHQRADAARINEQLHVPLIQQQLELINQNEVGKGGMN